MIRLALSSCRRAVAAALAVLALAGCQGAGGNDFAQIVQTFQHDFHNSCAVKVMFAVPTSLAGTLDCEPPPAELLSPPERLSKGDKRSGGPKGPAQ